MTKGALFGPAGNPDAFYQANRKSSAEMPEWLHGQGLGAYEYQCSRGVHVGEETASKIGAKAREFGIRLSIHAPYYINLTTQDEAIALNTRRHILKSLQAAKWMGADRVTFHIGGPGKQSRTEAMARASRLLASIVEEAEKTGLTGVFLAAETMGKPNQTGTLSEVLALCRLSKLVIPTVDFGHLHTASQGGYTTKEEFLRVFEEIGEVLGSDTAANLHAHFSKIEYTRAGEKRHWTFADPYGPPYEPLLELIAERGYTPRIICESAGTQALDAKTMQDYYRLLLVQCQI